MSELTLSDLKQKYDELREKVLVDREQLTDLQTRFYANEKLLNAYRLVLEATPTEEQSDGRG